MQDVTKNRRVSFGGFFEAAALVLAVFSVATLFGSVHRYFELFSHFKLQYLWSAVLLAVIFAVTRRPRLLGLCFGLTALNAWFVLPWYFGADEAIEGPSLKIMHANVLGYRNPDAKLLLDQVTSEQPDVVVLQEYTPGWHQALQNELAEYPYRLDEPQAGAFGIALLSKIPLENAQIVHAAPEGLPEIHAEMRLDGQTIHVVSAHPMPPMGKAWIESRNEQLLMLGNELGRAPRPTILVGDLNISMFAPTYRDFENRTGLRNARQGFGLAPTFPAFLPIALIPIDHVLVSDEFAVTDFRTGDNTGSDHLPIIATLVLKPDS